MIFLKISNFKYHQFNASLAIRHALWCSLMLSGALKNFRKCTQQWVPSQLNLIQIILFWCYFIFKYLQKIFNKELTTQDCSNILNFYESNYKTFITKYYADQALPQLLQMIILMSETETELKSLIEKNQILRNKVSVVQKWFY
jgi:hypothetical protein